MALSKLAIAIVNRNTQNVILIENIKVLLAWHECLKKTHLFCLKSWIIESNLIIDSLPKSLNLVSKLVQNLIQHT